MTRALLQDLFMLPVHLTEGLSVRWGFFRALYRAIAPLYGPPRPLLHFGEELFLAALRPGDRVLELGSGTGFLARKAGARAGTCVGLEREPAMVRTAAALGGPARYVAGSMESLPFRAGAFTRCLCLGSLHCADPRTVAAQVRRVLTDEGEFLLLTEARVIPRFAPASAPDRVRRALESEGFRVAEQRPVGRLYAWFRAVKRPGECG